MSLVLLLVACVTDAPQPYVGECAEYPDGFYDYGAIGIGSCLSGPIDLAWITDPDDAAGAVLLVTNSNPFLDFATSSVVTIPLDGVPLTGGEVTVSEAGGAGISIPNFASSMAVSETLGLAVVPSRFSDGARLREGDDEVWFVDLSVPKVPSLAAVASQGATSLKVKEDPTPVLLLPESGLVLVGNASDESITVIDLAASPVQVIDAIEEVEIAGIRVFDDDRSGSHIEVADLSVATPKAVPTDNWTLTYTLGTFRIWVPSGEGIHRLTSYGQEDWQASAVGSELEADDTDGVLTELFDPQIWESLLGTRMAFGDVGTGKIHSALNIGALTDWSYESKTLLSPRDDEWDAFLGGPMLLVSDDLEYLFYDGVSSPDGGSPGGIGLATSRDGEDFDRMGEMIVEPGAGAHDTFRTADPYVIYDDQSRTWRMWYGAFDGLTWRVGHATSTDLSSWTADSSAVFEATEGTHAAAPVVAIAGGWYRMWTSRVATDGTNWLGLAVSRDGKDWEDLGLVTPLEGDSSLIDDPVGVGLQALASESWSVHGEQSGQAGVSFQGSEGLVSDSFGWSARLSTGWTLAPVEGFDESANGVSASSWIPELDRIYVTLTGDDGESRVGSATWNEGDPVLDTTVLLEGGNSGFDSAGIFSPVVFETSAGWGMLYAGTNGTLTRMGRATSSDGLAWSRDAGAVLDVGSDWDSVEVIPGSVVQDGSSLVLYYTGSDGERRRIGAATSTDEGQNWTRLEGDRYDWVFDEGAPGEFDDSQVQDPYVVPDGSGLERMWYAGNDGLQWRVGYAERAEGEDDWTRFEDPTSGETLVVLDGVSGSFDVAGTQRPVVLEDSDGFTMLYSGQDSPVLRTGVARGPSPDVFYRQTAEPTTGDRVEFETRSGDAGVRKTIPLERVVDGFSVNGDALSGFALDSKGGFAFLASTSNSYVIVLDVRDDSEPWFDDNYLGVEAVLDARTNSGARGFRSLAVSGDRLYGLNDSPESVMIFDLSTVLDDDWADYVPEAVIGYLPAARGVEQDAGSDTLASVGPSGLAIRDNRLFVTNFNANSVGVYDLSLGQDGTLVDEIANIGENPHAVALSPDGGLLAVSLYVGETSRGTAESSIVLIDVDPDSPSYLDVLARIVNR